MTVYLMRMIVYLLNFSLLVLHGPPKYTMVNCHTSPTISKTSLVSQLPLVVYYYTENVTFRSRVTGLHLALIIKKSMTSSNVGFWILRKKVIICPILRTIWHRSRGHHQKNWLPFTWTIFNIENNLNVTNINTLQ